MTRETVNSPLSGVIPPIITPVDDEDRVDEPAFRRVLRHVIAGGVHGIFVGGSAGEGPLLTMPEWVRMVEIAFDETRGSVPLLGGVMETSTRRTVERIRVLKQIGYTYYVVTPVFYLRMSTVDEHLRLFGACVDAADGMEMIPYNIPVFTGNTMPIDALVETARRGWARCCKESSGDIDYFMRLAAAGGAYGLKLFMGDERAMREGLRAGAVGIVPGCANFEPATYVAAYRAAVMGDAAGLERHFSRMMELRERLVLVSPCWLSGIKYAVACLGMGSGQPVSPLHRLTEAEARGIREFVALSTAQIA
jgi:4-hydroxy-tetrahydrodipicolinate synthase